MSQLSQLMLIIAKVGSLRFPRARARARTCKSDGTTIDVPVLPRLFDRHPGSQIITLSAHLGGHNRLFNFFSSNFTLRIALKTRPPC